LGARGGGGAAGWGPQEAGGAAGLGRLLPELALALRAVAFLWDYRLVVPRGAGAEVWMGIRRTRRASIALVGPPPPEGQPVLADCDGRPTLALSPIVQVAPPAP